MLFFSLFITPAVAENAPFSEDAIALVKKCQQVFLQQTSPVQIDQQVVIDVGKALLCDLDGASDYDDKKCACVDQKLQGLYKGDQEKISKEQLILEDLILNVIRLNSAEFKAETQAAKAVGDFVRATAAKTNFSDGPNQLKKIEAACSGKATQSAFWDDISKDAQLTEIPLIDGGHLSGVISDIALEAIAGEDSNLTQASSALTNQDQKLIAVVANAGNVDGLISICESAYERFYKADKNPERNFEKNLMNDFFQSLIRKESKGENFKKQIFELANSLDFWVDGQGHFLTNALLCQYRKEKPIFLTANPAVNKVAKQREVDILKTQNKILEKELLASKVNLKTNKTFARNSNKIAKEIRTKENDLLQNQNVIVDYILEGQMAKFTSLEDEREKLAATLANLERSQGLFLAAGDAFEEDDSETGPSRSNADEISSQMAKNFSEKINEIRALILANSLEKTQLVRKMVQELKAEHQIDRTENEIAEFIRQKKLVESPTSLSAKFLVDKVQNWKKEMDPRGTSKGFVAMMSANSAKVERELKQMGYPSAIAKDRRVTKTSNKGSTARALSPTAPQTPELPRGPGVKNLATPKLPPSDLPSAPSTSSTRINGPPQPKPLLPVASADNEPLAAAGEENRSRANDELQQKVHSLENQVERLLAKLEEENNRPSSSGSGAVGVNGPDGGSQAEDSVLNDRAINGEERKLAAAIGPTISAGPNPLTEVQAAGIAQYFSQARVPATAQGQGPLAVSSQYQGANGSNSSGDGVSLPSLIQLFTNKAGIKIEDVKAEGLPGQKVVEIGGDKIGRAGFAKESYEKQQEMMDEVLKNYIQYHLQQDDKEEFIFKFAGEDDKIYRVSGESKKAIAQGIKRLDRAIKESEFRLQVLDRLIDDALVVPLKN